MIRYFHSPFNIIALLLFGRIFTTAAAPPPNQRIVPVMIPVTQGYAPHGTNFEPNSTYVMRQQIVVEPNGLKHYAWEECPQNRPNNSQPNWVPGCKVVYFRTRYGEQLARVDFSNASKHVANPQLVVTDDGTTWIAFRSCFENEVCSIQWAKIPANYDGKPLTVQEVGRDYYVVLSSNGKVVYAITGSKESPWWKYQQLASGRSGVINESGHNIVLRHGLADVAYMAAKVDSHGLLHVLFKSGSTTPANPSTIRYVAASNERNNLSLVFDSLPCADYLGLAPCMLDLAIDHEDTVYITAIDSVAQTGRSSHQLKLLKKTSSAKTFSETSLPLNTSGSANRWFVQYPKIIFVNDGLQPAIVFRAINTGEQLENRLGNLYYLELGSLPKRVNPDPVDADVSEPIVSVATDAAGKRSPVISWCDYRPESDLYAKVSFNLNNPIAVAQTSDRFFDLPASYDILLSETCAYVVANGASTGGIIANRAKNHVMLFNDALPYAVHLPFNVQNKLTK